jgi:hypothetical protein
VKIKIGQQVKVTVYDVDIIGLVRAVNPRKSLCRVEIGQGIVTLREDDLELLPEIELPAS